MNQRFEGSPASDDIDRQLLELAVQAQKYPHRSEQRQLALNSLVQRIWKSNRLGHPQKGAWTPTLYEDIYNEALQETLLNICQKIDNYNSDYPVMAWVNFILDKRFIAVVNGHKRQGITNIPRDECLPSFDDLDRDIPIEASLSDDQLLQQFLEDDPENLLKNERLREHPDVTFQFLALERLVKDRAWAEIADDLSISIQTLCSFFNRGLRKLMPYFHKYLYE